MMQIRFFFIFCFFFISLFGDTIDTFYSSLNVEEAVLLELIQSPGMQRLKYTQPS